MEQKNKKTVEDIDLNKIDIGKYRFTLKAGTTLARVIIGKFDPRIPTGQGNRYGKNPNNVSAEEYIQELWEGNAISCSTGNICCADLIITAYKEVFKKSIDNIEKAIAYELTIIKDISVIDTISICLSEDVDPTPKEEVDFWHSFYGPPIHAQALRCRSAQDPNGENIIIFPDNIPDYSSSISFKEYSKDETESAIKQIQEHN